MVHQKLQLCQLLRLVFRVLEEHSMSHWLVLILEQKERFYVSMVDVIQHLVNLVRWVQYVDVLVVMMILIKSEANDSFAAGILYHQTFILILVVLFNTLMAL